MAKLFPVAVVTGASRGIGKAIVKKLSSEGVSCVALASSRKSISNIKLGDHLHVLHDAQRHRSLAIDFSDWPKWTQIKKHYGIDYQMPKAPLIESNYVASEFGLFDMLRSWSSPENKYYLALLVNCAGITQASLSVRTDPTTMARILNVNLMSCVSLCNMAIKHMVRDRKFVRRNPSIINIGSILGTESSPVVAGTSLYAASKAALNHYSRVLSEEISGLDIAVETVNPGLVPQSDMIKMLDISIQEQLRHSMGPESTSTEKIASIIWDLYTRA
ncbi:hypothetical protein HG536_0G01010 [Torulaspora globosa]|uniref:3-oxoacyl-[acyl-carrier-protein] reductase n=1 Tax=Torulaspora globosa TaxID=48254 RepID=A0A7G3ZL58_9SACH|nr:uncharacterized protein HG536_0G01010 [Torulaspora globosa]QLL34244.1 hypothetical protein HG536_0G01010 [Torulaspora globosa]